MPEIVSIGGMYTGLTRDRNTDLLDRVFETRVQSVFQFIYSDDQIAKLSSRRQHTIESEDTQGISDGGAKRTRIVGASQPDQPMKFLSHSGHRKVGWAD